MDSVRGPLEPQLDLSSLSWVHDELRRSLEAAHKSLRRFVKEQESLGASDVDVVDPGILRSARASLHQGVGALELVGLPEAAAILRTAEAVVQRYIGKPQKLTALAVEDIERASFALLDFMARLIGGKSVSPLALFPQYRRLQELAGAERIHPADLWHTDWRWRGLPPDHKVLAIPADDDARAMFEAQLLRTMRGGEPHTTAAGMSDLCAGLGMAAQGEAATLWKLASAMFEAQAQGLLGFDVYSKRVASRLMAQFRAMARGDGEVSERLAQDLLFFCAQSASPGAGKSAPRLAAVRAAYNLASHVPVDYEHSTLGRHDPTQVTQARKRVVAAKDSWAAVAGGEMVRLQGLAEQFALVGESLRRLFPHGDTFAGELQQAVAVTQQLGAAPSPELAMEVATALLYVEAALEDSEFDNPVQAERVQRLASRVEEARRGAASAPLEPWMEELYRRVSDRQTMGSVVQELRAALAEAEKAIDAFFRNPAANHVLIPVPGQLAAMRGVLSVLGMDQASAALLRMRDEVDGLASTAVDPDRVRHAGVFDRLAGNLGALGFLIDMLSVQPAMAKSLFVWDAARGLLEPVMGRGARSPAPSGVDARIVEQAQVLAQQAADASVPADQIVRDLGRLSAEAHVADQTGLVEALDAAQRGLAQADDDDALHSVRGELSERLVDFVASATEPIGLDAVPPTPVPSSTVELAEDDEMREIFLEEAREVVAAASEAAAGLRAEPGSVELLTTVRRAFHTLKGSARMVGLKDFGEAGWICEQIYNVQLAEQRPAEPVLLDFTDWVLGHLGAWVDEIAARGAVTHTAADVQRAAERMAGGGEAAVPASIAAAPLGLPPDLPSAADLDLRIDLSDLSLPAAPPELPAPAEALDFELDLSALDGAVAAAPEPAPPTTPAVAPPAAPVFDPEATLALPLVPEAEPAPVAAQIEPIALDLSFDEVRPTTEAAPAEPEPEAESAPEAAREAVEEVKVVGPLRIAIPLFNIYLSEADELSRRLGTELAEWALELHRPVGGTAVALAHSLGGSSATVGFADLSSLARSLEAALTHADALGHGTADDAAVFVDAADEIRRLLHQFAAGFLVAPSPDLVQRVAACDAALADRLAAQAEEPIAPAVDPGFDLPVAEVTQGGDSAFAAFLPEGLPELAPEVVAPAADPPMVDAPVADAPLVDAPVADAPVAEPSVPEAAAEDIAFEPEAFEPEAAAEPVAAEPAVLTSDFLPPSDSTFGRDSVFDALGVAPLQPLAALDDSPPPAAQPSRATLDEDRLVLDEDIDAVDAVDAELFPIFEEEAQELLPQLASALRDWAARPADGGAAASCMRTLHTLKGGARLAGAMRLGELAHRLETRIEHLIAAQSATPGDVEDLQSRGDLLSQVFDQLRRRDAEAYAAASAAVIAAVEAPAEPVSEPPPAPAAEEAAPVAQEPAPAVVAPPVAAPAVAALPIDWSRFTAAGPAAKNVAPAERISAVQAAVRVRVPLLDRLVNHAGEVSITRSRIESSVGALRASLVDLTENLDRLRQQLRDIELQAETQMTSRMEAAKAVGAGFDPLEFDRFTRFQELTRMMAESVNDVATVQRTLQRSIDAAEDELAAQARLTRDLQDDLLRTRMVEFEGLSDRLYRVVRLAAKETGKQVRLDIVGGAIEVDRGVLDRMTPAFEHLLRNCVAHGIELPSQRLAAGKEAAGLIRVAVTQEGNEVGVEFRDDGRGLDLPRIRARGVALGLLDPNANYGDADLANLIFTPGFTTAETVTELAGRGIGMDVVKNEVGAMGGRVETATAAGQGTAFKLVLPLTTAVTQVVMVRIGEIAVAIPSTLVEIVRRASLAEIEASATSGTYAFGDRILPFFWLGALLQTGARSTESGGRMRPVLVVRSANQRVAIQVDEVLGNQEVVVKNLGPQLSRMPGLAGMTLLASGVVALIYNPVALATLYGEAARAATAAAMQAVPDDAPAQPAVAEPAEPLAPLVMVVDDSLTVRRVTQRLLVREGYRVTLAKDGLEALERLADERPAVLLSDIEMPRMDGFDLVRNVRGDVRLGKLPVIMITSRIAQKHRDYAAELGVDHYLGKPYSEEDLLALVGRYAHVTPAPA
jgi:chemosensory pili system protein ChpA (sensor histidine kinase/response regulator)